jgi:hypothetical protein
VSLESANLALARVFGILPWADEEPASSIKRRGRRTGAARWDGSFLSPWNLTLLVGARTAPRKMDREVAAGPCPCRPPRVVCRTSDGDEAATETGRQKPEKGIEGRRQAEHLLRRFRCTNDTMINNHPSPMKGPSQVYSNGEQFAFPLLICNQIFYHVFLHQP